MNRASWLALPILAAIVALIWFAQERRGGPQRQQPCPQGQALVLGGDYGTPGCAVVEKG